MPSRLEPVLAVERAKQDGKEVGVLSRQVRGRDMEPEADGEEPSGKAMAILSTMVGAVLLSRAVNDKRLSKQFLHAAAESVLMASSAGDAQQGPRQ